MRLEAAVASNTGNGSTRSQQSEAETELCNGWCEFERWEWVVYLCGECGVRILQSSCDTILLRHSRHFRSESHDCVVLLVRLAKSLLELLVSVDEALNTFTSSRLGSLKRRLGSRG